MFVAGTAVFTGNEAAHGGAIGLSGSELSCDGGAAVFLDGNTALTGGGMTIIESTVHIGKCTLNIANNIASFRGGGIYIGKLLFDLGNRMKKSVLSANFVDNIARSCGGALYIENERNIVLRQMNVTNNSDCALCISDSTAIFTSTRFPEDMEY